ncbi:FAD-binding domain [Dillenia turbinata]|uniref:FAD-binding domain n=1 Tax=Dillenia turbinata TaxID=194707 RepID=A0AAN8Z1F0_9MAGN
MAGDPKLIQKRVIEKYCKDFPAEYLDVVHQCDLATLTWAPLVFRYPWDVISGNLCKGGVVVAGDAMHPMTPDLGQGGCAALEDAVVLGRHIGEIFLKNQRIVPQDVGVALGRFVSERRWRTAGLITGSYLSGWAQQTGNNWWMKFLRDIIFYKFLYPKIFDSIRYNCGKLPYASPSQNNSDNPNKMD